MGHRRRARGGSIHRREHRKRRAGETSPGGQRQARIAAILQPVLAVTGLPPGPNTTDPDRAEALRCQWIDPTTGMTAVDVFVDAPAELGDLRAQVSGDDADDPDSAAEIPCPAAGEYAFVRWEAHSVTAILGGCRVQRYPPDNVDDLAALVELALQIGRTVGCSPYRDDYDTGTPRPRWGMGPGLPGIPPSQPEL